MSEEQRALPPLDDFEDPSDLSVRIPPVLPPLNLVAVSRPLALEPLTRVDNGTIPKAKLDIVSTVKADSAPSRIVHSVIKDNPNLPVCIDPADLKDRSRKRQKLDFFQLPKPKSSTASTNPSSFPPIPLLNGLRQPPPSAALFPPITPQKHSVPVLDFGPPITRETVQAVEDGSGADVVINPEKAKRHYLRGRKAWTDDETKDLLKGVDIYGVGKWKSILKHKSFCFHSERTAVDLKDRYRTYQMSITRPKKHRLESQKQLIRPRKGYTRQKSVAPQEDGVEEGHDSQREFEVSTIDDVKELLDSSTKELTKKDAGQRFTRWTHEEDLELVKGSRKHGFKWSAIANDSGIGLEHRSAGQIRDRFRIKYPRNYETNTPLSLFEDSNGSKESVVLTNSQNSANVAKTKTRGNLDWLLQDVPKDDSNDSFAHLSKDLSSHLPKDEKSTTKTLVQSLQHVDLEAMSKPASQLASQTTTETVLSSQSELLSSTEIVVDRNTTADALASMDTAIEHDESRNLNIEELLNEDIEPLSQLPPLQFPFNQDWSGDAYDDSLTLAPLLWGGYDFATGQWVGSMN